MSNVFEMIKAQQGKDRSAVWMVGEQLMDIIRDQPALQEIVSQDLKHDSMKLAACEKKIKEYADKHRTGNFACVTGAEAEGIIREFYGLSVETAAVADTKTVERADVVDLTAFF